VKRFLFACLGQIFFISCALSAHAESTESSPLSENFEAGIFHQKIDHSLAASTTKTFAQRYWVSQYDFGHDESTPILLRICGEAACENHAHTDGVHSMATALGARVVYLEHRYYGKSQPFADLSSKNLRYLTLQNVIEDTAEFERFMIHKKQWRGKWIAIGSSYSGTLAAIYRLRHPELVVGALASSAPMMAKPLPEYSAEWMQYRISSAKVSFDEDYGERQWAYQACTELPFWSADDRNALIIPTVELCEETFGLHVPIALQSYNQAYYLPFVSANGSASNILFTNGTKDKWSELTIKEVNNHNPKINTFTIDGSGHGFDLAREGFGSSEGAVLEAKRQFISYARKWLNNSTVSH
jgi:pimeloyl-ACP methyl ester carboxylesterase